MCIESKVVVVVQVMMNLSANENNCTLLKMWKELFVNHDTIPELRMNFLKKLSRVVPITICQNIKYAKYDSAGRL